MKSILYSLIYLTACNAQTLFAYFAPDANAQPEGNNYRGRVVLQQIGSVVKLSFNIRGLEPYSTHGIHIHESAAVVNSDLTCDCAASGGHWNPANLIHTQHAGDLGNFQANKFGSIRGSRTYTTFSLGAENDESNPFNRAIVVHENQDDLGEAGIANTQTSTGNSGARLMCGNIGPQKQRQAS